MVNAQSFKSKLFSEFSMGFLPILPTKMGMIHSTPYGFRPPAFSGESIILQHYGNWPRVYAGKPKGWV